MPDLDGPTAQERLRLLVNGRVQGVGFRPAVYRLATSLSLGGWVANTSSGVVIEIEGPAPQLERFQSLLVAAPPASARIESVARQSVPVTGAAGFEIRSSRQEGPTSTLLPPDLALCTACRTEMNTPADRRLGYPFINCTDCGPRFTIALGLPYDRPKTTMARFRMCAACQAEYDDPATRRFHAQPNACSRCGPCLEFVSAGTAQDGATARSDAECLRRAVQVLSGSGIVAIQSIGGFHLACDAGSDDAVAELRRRKARPDKPFALMVRGLEDARRICHVGEAEARLLASPAAPIVMLRRKPGDTGLSALVAPGLDSAGVMLTYTPLHEALFALLGPGRVLVMTSGNRQDEPICHTRDEALRELSGLADAFVIHDRPIHNRCDDSIVSVHGESTRVIRRARGFVPDPLELALDGPSVLGCGADLKGAFCLTRGPQAFLSQHLGDLLESSNASFFREALRRMTALLGARPTLAAHDLHPDSIGTRLAAELPCPRLAVQHHHAHVASVIAEHRLQGPVLGVAFDGTGLGPDGTIWGGEFLLVRGSRFERLAHLKAVPLPGGDAAARQGWRMALSWLTTLHGEDALTRLGTLLRGVEPQGLAVTRRMIERRFNSPLTSSMGRLFDAVASLAGVRHESSYEAQAAMELESLAGDVRPGPAYPFDDTRLDPSGAMEIDPGPCLTALLDDVARGIDVGSVSARFHRGVARMVADVCIRLCAAHALETIVLSGGCFQNRRLLGWTLGALTGINQRVITNLQSPANDGGIALGQAWIALHALAESGCQARLEKGR